jgi:hypothetical protein
MSQATVVTKAQIEVFIKNDPVMLAAFTVLYFHKYVRDIGAKFLPDPATGGYEALLESIQEQSKLTPGRNLEMFKEFFDDKTQ